MKANTIFDNVLFSFVCQIRKRKLKASKQSQIERSMERERVRER
jgi:hypothetical protein